MTHPVRFVPAVHEIMQSEEFHRLQYRIPKEVLKEWIQLHIDQLRNNILAQPETYKDVTRESLRYRLVTELEREASTYRPNKLHRVLNGTGTVLHTNLGRARLSEEAILRVVETSRHYSTLEYNVEKGTRGSRHDIIEDLLLKVTGSEAAMAVNNNAAAVYLILRALSKGKEVIVSRGELVEIGGSFRVSTIMEESDAKLVEVGTTNKTHPFDYEDAITDNTAMMMKVHTSNFKTVGFTKEVTTGELKEIASLHEKESGRSIIIYEDLGSGSLYPFRHDGIGDEPVVKEAMNHGADIISFSGDKLLGGPQAGIIAGKKELVDKIKKHPLARVLRVDKMTLAALEATLQSYVYGKENGKNIPTIRDVLQTEEEIRHKVEAFVTLFSQERGDSSPFTMEVRIDTSLVGGGTMPTVERPTVGVKVKKEGLSANQLEQAFRTTDIPVITRVKESEVFIDFRTIAEEEIPLLVDAFQEMERKLERS